MDELTSGYRIVIGWQTMRRALRLCNRVCFMRINLHFVGIHQEFKIVTERLPSYRVTEFF